MRIFTHFYILIILVCLTPLALTACRQGRGVPVTRLPLTETMPTAPPAEPEQPRPVPTALAAFGGARLVVGPEDGNPLHGAPPFTVSLFANYYPQPAGLSAPCAQLEWTFGDGQEETVPCRITAEAAPHDWQVSHRYETPGIYHAAARMVLQDGAVIESDKTQTVLAATAQRPALDAMALRWMAWLLTLLAIGAALIWILRQRGRRRWAGAVLLGFFLITFIPPFSYAPDPLGIVLAFTGGYSHDPRLPFANRFLVSGNATAELRPTLDALVGQTGLDPLDPVSSLARYEFVKVSRDRRHTAVDVRFTYESGVQRIYSIPLRHPTDPQLALGFYPCCWRFDGLGRLRTEHVVLPPASPARHGDLTVGAPERLPLPAIDAKNTNNWFAAGRRSLGRRLEWSPHGDAFLAPATDDVETTLWLLALDGSVAHPVAEAVWEYAWTPQGDAILYSTVSMAQGLGASDPQRHIMRVAHDGEERQRLLSLPVGHSAFPGISSQGLWYARDGALWLLPWDTPEEGAQRITEMMPQNTGNRGRLPAQVRPAPDGERLAYTCGAALCLVDATGENHVVAVSDERFVSMAWRPDGQQLAAVFWDYTRESGQAAILRILERNGTVRAEVTVAPDGPADAPQWAPDGALWLQTYPQDGRRVLRVTPEEGLVVDYSQPRWDAFFALHPDGDRLLLSNGRGGFWLSALLAPVE